MEEILLWELHRAKSFIEEKRDEFKTSGRLGMAGRFNYILERVDDALSIRPPSPAVRKKGRPKGLILTISGHPLPIAYSPMRARQISIPDGPP